ncbi:MAG: DUF3618 domain-containing protein [Actinomycetota bacterium]
MGQGPAETVKEIENIRERLAEDVRELEDRLPGAAWARRAVGAAVGTGLGGAIVAVVRRRRKRKRAKAVDGTPVTAAITLVPQEWADRLARGFEKGSWKPWATAIIAIWLALRLAELRRLRRLQRAILAGRP